MEGNSRVAQTSGKPGPNGYNRKNPSVITIHELLEYVKDNEGTSYINDDGIGNFSILARNYYVVLTQI